MLLRAVKPCLAFAAWAALSMANSYSSAFIVVLRTGWRSFDRFSVALLLCNFSAVVETTFALEVLRSETTATSSSSSDWSPSDPVVPDDLAVTYLESSFLF